MDTHLVDIETPTTRSVVDITAHAAEFVSGRGDGLLSIFAPHATAGLALLEIGAGCDTDLIEALGELFRDDYGWRHTHGSPGHGGDHVIPAFISPSMVIPVIDGQLALGTWQSITFVDPNRDNTKRKIRFSFLEG